MFKLLLIAQHCTTRTSPLADKLKFPATTLYENYGRIQSLMRCVCVHYSKDNKHLSYMKIDEGTKK